MRRSARWAHVARCGGRCAYCTRALPATAPVWARSGLDHYRGTEVGNGVGNVLACCRACNAAKGELSPRAWARYLAAVRGCTSRVVRSLLGAQLAQPLDRAEGLRLAAIERTRGYAAAMRAVSDRSVTA